MLTRILLLTDNTLPAKAVKQQLRDNGLQVIVLDNIDEIGAMISEINPSSILFLSNGENNRITSAYNSLAADNTFTALPLIFALQDNESYLVNTGNAGARKRKEILFLGLMPAIRAALHIGGSSERAYRLHRPSISIPQYTFRA